MFTGIVAATATVESLAEVAAAVRGSFQLSLRTPLAAVLKVGDSLAVDGCCLTATDLGTETIRFDLLAETLRRTTFGGLGPGDLVNLERPMAADGRFDGHIVQGHVDTTAEVISVTSIGRDHRLEVALPAGFEHYVVFKGSIAVNGVSLTVAELRESGFVVWIIPHTWEVTNLRALQLGRRVNLEFDLVAKYVERMLASSPVWRVPAAAVAAEGG
ncbi:MAG: riboflavin synthase [Verrucomicrobia bacterium]|nr:riboflavin synthase [Verrucomicrobiota bacterium]